MISKLHYITQDIKGVTHSELAERACEAGVEWVQLRMKGVSITELREEALKVRKVCRKYGAVFILNDHPELALEVKADGVHLGKKDMPLDEARKLLGDNRILGATCNSYEDIAAAVQHQIDYVGVGPFRHTTTKKELSPILGVEGYKAILGLMHNSNNDIPLIAIGGVELEDIAPLRKVGVDGIAVASLINKAKDQETIVDNLKLELTKEL